MEKRIMLFFILIFIFAGGCGMNSEQGNGRENQESLPETRAFKDEFTRGFMKSTEETEEGYYTFESKTKVYTMLFPENGKISMGDYEQIDTSYETLSFAEKIVQENVTYFITINFEETPHAKNTSMFTKQLSIATGYSGEYTPYKLDDKTIYYGEYDDRDSGLYFYNAYIVSNKSDKGIRFVFSGRCTDEPKSCHPSPSVIKDRIKRVTESIKFS
ncbi:hypothetical protein WKH31_09285 [Metabacillus indicus]|uniref:hypothetical protein n=1 Tax=Metabacillus indicus TaxID=246786 RepID=UPI0031724392